MARGNRRLFHAAFAVASLLLAVAGAGNSAAAPPDGDAADSSPGSTLDRLFGEWNAAGLEEFAGSSVDSGYATLASAAAAFLQRDFRRTLLSAAEAAGSPDEEIRRRGESLVDMTSAWKAVFKDLASYSISKNILLMVPSSESDWGKEIDAIVPSLVDPYFAYFDFKPDRPVPVVFLENLDQLAAVSRVPASRLEKSGTAAVTMFGHIFLVSPSFFPDGYEWDTVLSHEMVHLVVHARTGGRMPHFMDEGIASLLQEWSTRSRLKELTPLEKALLQLAVDRGLFLDWKTLDEPFWKLENKAAIDVAFLQVRLAAAELSDRGGQDPLPRFVEAVGAGKSWQEAVRAVAGISADSLASSAKWRWRNSGSRAALEHYLYGPGRQFLPEKGKRVLEQGQQTVLLGDLLWGSGSGKAALQVYLRLPDELQATPDAVWRIAQLLVAGGRLTEAKKRVRAALKLHPGDSKVMFCAARVLALKNAKVFSQEDNRDARRLARRAWLVNPFAKETNEMLQEMKINVSHEPKGSEPEGTERQAKDSL